MHYLIVYMSRHGTTEKVANELDEKLGGIKTLIDLGKDQVPDLTKFDTVIIGGSVHAGTIQKKLRDFCRQNMKRLLKVRLGLFMCFMNDELQEKEFENSFPFELRKHAIAKGFVGGEFIIEKMNALEKLAVRKVKGIEQSISRLDQDAIDRFIEEIKR